MAPARRTPWWRRGLPAAAAAALTAWAAASRGGPGASDDLSQAHLTQVWLAVSEDPAATVSGAYFYHKARLKLGADWLDVPEPVATLLQQHLRHRSNMTTAANPASSWLFPGQLAGEHRSYRRLVRVLRQLGIPARASRLAAWREMVREAPPAVLADALGVSAGTAMRHAFLGGVGWSAYAAHRHAHTPGDETSQ